MAHVSGAGASSQAGRGGKKRGKSDATEAALTVVAGGLLQGPKGHRTGFGCGSGPTGQERLAFRPLQAPSREPRGDSAFPLNQRSLRGSHGSQRENTVDLSVKCQGTPTHTPIPSISDSPRPRSQRRSPVSLMCSVRKVNLPPGEERRVNPGQKPEPGR